MPSRHNFRLEAPRNSSDDNNYEGIEKEAQKEKSERGREKHLPADAQPISDSDYFLKNNEFRKWLKEEKDRYFDELSGEKARSYFHKFVKAWNRGKLPKSYYTGNGPVLSASEQTAYRWSFAGKRTAKEKATLDATCSAIDAATRSAAHGNEGADSIRDDYAATSASSRSKRDPSRVVGPTMPTAEDRVLMREAFDEERVAERAYQRKRARQEDKERVEDMVGPKEQGREGALEKKRARREADRSSRDAKDDAFGDFDESTLMGGGDSFQARIAQRDAARRRYQEKRQSTVDDKHDTVRDRQEAIRAKDNATMEMFKQLAKEKFGA